MTSAEKIMKRKSFIKAEMDRSLPGPQSDDLWEKATEKLAEILTRYSALPKGVHTHTDNFIFPSAAVYLTVQEAAGKEKAYEIIENAAIIHCGPIAAKLAVLMKVPGMTGIFVRIWDPLTKKIFGPDNGFQNVFYPKKKGEFRMDILACPYCRYFGELGCPELTKIFCGQIDFLQLFMFLLVITRIYAPFDQALALIAEMFMSQISASRLMEIYDTKTAEGKENFSPKGHDIIFDNVGFAYDDKEVLHGVSFTAKEGNVTALVGPSGSGKSSCARLATRLWDISDGTIKVGDTDISTIDPETLLTDYAMVFQDVVLFDDTVMENIRLGKHGASDEEVQAAAKAANCDEFVRKLPQGYDTPIGENGAKLSGGERQRISIARALLKDAPIVLLDEATASLDVENETKVQEALSRLLVHKTVLVIAHRMRTVEAADKIVVLTDGRVAEEGSPNELIADENSIFRRMTQLQASSSNWSI